MNRDCDDVKADQIDANNDDDDDGDDDDDDDEDDDEDDDDDVKADQIDGQELAADRA